MKSVVYWIRHKEHNDIFSQGYVGVSNNTNRRFAFHKTSGKNPHLQHAIAKYADDIVFDTVLVADRDYCFEMEYKLRPTKTIGWNIAAGGGKLPSRKGIKHTEETLEKMRAKVISDEQKEKMSIALTGREFTEEHKQKISQSLQGVNTWTAGRTLSDEHKQAISVANQNRSPELIEQVASKHRGAKRSAEACENIRKGKQNISDETRARMSDSAKKRCARQKQERLSKELEK